MFYKIVKDNYIISVVSALKNNGTEISKTEYDTIINLIYTKPKAESGFSYRLKDNLEWELVELPPMPEDDEISDSEALEIIKGGAI